jgi:hypothetical protein
MKSQVDGAEGGGLDNLLISMTVIYQPAFRAAFGAFFLKLKNKEY